MLGFRRSEILQFTRRFHSGRCAICRHSLATCKLVKLFSFWRGRQREMYLSILTEIDGFRLKMLSNFEHSSLGPWCTQLRAQLRCRFCSFEAGSRSFTLWNVEVFLRFKSLWRTDFLGAIDIRFAPLVLQPKIQHRLVAITLAFRSRNCFWGSAPNRRFVGKLHSVRQNHNFWMFDTRLNKSYKISLSYLARRSLEKLQTAVWDSVNLKFCIEELGFSICVLLICITSFNEFRLFCGSFGCWWLTTDWDCLRSQLSE